MNKYISHRRFKGDAICGKVNIPAGTELTEIGGMLFLGKDAVCCAQSENAHQYFAKNNDGCGMLRGRLTQCIQKALVKPDRPTAETVAEIGKRWDMIWEDKVCAKYKRSDAGFEDYWLWNHDFFEANILDLKYISGMIGATK